MMGRIASGVGLAVLLAGSAAAADGAAARQQAATHTVSARPADAIAQDFYGWYVGLMAHDKEPSDDAAGYARYVTTQLRATIARKMASADGMDVDYFVKTQDYLDEWVGHVAASPAVMHGTTARTVVTLGRGGKAWRLAVTLVRENGVWKISGVTRA